MRNLVSVVAKTALVVCFFVGSGLVQAQPPGTLSYQAQGLNAQRVIAELADKTGLKLSLAPELSREVLAILVRDVPREELLTRIATVLGAEWRESAEGGRRLEISPARAAAEQRTEREARVSAMRQRMGEIREAIARGEAEDRKRRPPEEETPSEYPEGEREEPWTLFGEERAVARMLLRLDPVLLANLGPGERLVFASTPNRMQRPLGPVEAEVATIVQEHNDSAKAWAEAEAAAPEAAFLEDPTEAAWLQALGIDPKPRPIRSAPAKALLFISRGGGPLGWLIADQDQGLSVTLRLYDEQGAVLLESDHPELLNREDTMRQMAALLAEQAGDGSRDAKPEAENTSARIEYSATTIELRRAMQAENLVNWSENKLSPELVERITRPDLHDPLSFEATEGVFAVAKAKGANVVANLPDAIAGGGIGMAAAMMMGRSPTLDGFWKDLQEGPTRAELKDGWIMVWPEKMAATRERRMDRQVLARLIATSIERGVATLDDFAAYAAVNESPMQAPIAYIYIMIFAPNITSSGMSGMIDWNLLRFYGRLSPGQRQALRAGARIPLAALDARQREVVHKMVFGVAARLRPVDAPTRPSGGPWMDLIAEFVPRPQTSFLEEPTEAMPNGLSGEAYVSVEAVPDFVLSMPGVGGRSTGAMVSMGPEEVAMMRMFTEDPQFAQMAGMMPKIDKVSIGARTKLNFRFVLTPRVYTRGTLLDDRFEKGAPSTPYASLPEAFERRIQALLTDMKKFPFPMFGGMGGFGQPNPRP